MPKREDIKSILVIGSGPIVIGQACEFDYSGPSLQGPQIRWLPRHLGELQPRDHHDRPPSSPIAPTSSPSRPEFVERGHRARRPDALLPTLGGQTGLNTAVDLAKSGVLDKYGVEMIGCDLEAIERGEDRKLFNGVHGRARHRDRSLGYAYSVADAEEIVAELGFPVVLRPSFTLGGAGGGIAHDIDELRLIVSQGIELSPAGEVLVESPSKDGKSSRWRSCATVRQRHHRLLDRERRPHGRAHRRLHHRRSCSDAFRRGVPTHARASHRHPPRGSASRPGGSNVQFAVNPETAA